MISRQQLTSFGWIRFMFQHPVSTIPLTWCAHVSLSSSAHTRARPIGYACGLISRHEIHMRVSLFHRWAGARSAIGNQLTVQCNQYWVEFRSVSTWCSINLFDSRLKPLRSIKSADSCCINHFSRDFRFTWSWTVGIISYQSYQVSFCRQKEERHFINKNRIYAKLLAWSAILQFIFENNRQKYYISQCKC